MKTTLDISDELLARAKRFAKRAGKSLRAVVEESLQATLARAGHDKDYELPDCAVGTAGADDPLERMSWQDLRAEIYGPSGH
jgi:hypothetical protein